MGTLVKGFMAVGKVSIVLMCLHMAAEWKTFNLYNVLSIFK